MPRIEIRFYAELNDFLPAARRARAFSHGAAANTPLKDVIEGLGVPHPEIDLVLVNGQSVDLAYVPRDGDRVAVYPVFEAFDIASVTRIRPEPLRQMRFVLDVHLGRLVALLRMAGFDSSYSTHASDASLAATASRDGRILLTRDQALLKRRLVTHGYYVRSSHPPTQFTEVMRRFDAWRLLRPFTRCLRCNSVLGAASPEAIAELAPPRVRARHDEFSFCARCGRLYWKGTHHARMRRLLEGAQRRTEDADRDLFGRS
jgi:uncharacterized protein with PIN domain